MMPSPDAKRNGFSLCDVKVCLNNKSYLHECPPVVIHKSEAITKPLLLIAYLLLGDYIADSESNSEDGNLSYIGPPEHQRKEQN